MSPNPFLVVGAMKSGTTTLHAVLQGHPDVHVVGDKESATFLQPDKAARTARLIQASAAVAACEVSTAYMQQPMHAPPVDTAAATLGDELRIVAILRDPFARAVSHWQHWRQLGREPGEAIDVLMDPVGPYMAFSSYCRQLQPWIDRFGVDSVHVLRLEDYRASPASTLAALWAFLGVKALGSQDAIPRHENIADHRVVALGRARGVTQSTFYRGVLRPLVPTALRRAGATALGGAKDRPPTPNYRMRSANGSWRRSIRTSLG